MARSEARLSVSIWNDADFIALPPSAQRMFMFLISQPDLAHDGVIALRERRWSKSAAGLTAADVAADLDTLAAARFVVIDEDTEELLVRSFIRRDKVYRQPNVLRAAQDHISVVTSRAILAEIGAELRRITSMEEVGEGSASIIAEMLEAIEKAPGNPSANPSGEGSSNPTAGTPGERGVVTAVSSDSPFLVPRSPDPRPQQRAKRAAPRASARDRGTRIPNDFAVTDEMKTWFAANCQNVDGPRETEKFINYWQAKAGKDATKLDWIKTWKNWMLNAAERASSPMASRGNSGRPANYFRSAHSTNPFNDDGEVA